MESSFLLLSCDNGKSIDVADHLSELSGVKEAIPVYGTYDCVVITEQMPSEDVRELVFSSIRPVSGVHSVLTLTSEPPVLQH